jgi:hypothetical protein
VAVPGKQGLDLKVCTSVPGKDIMADSLVKDGETVKFMNDDAVKCRTRCEFTGGCNCYAFDPSRDNTCWLKTGACEKFYDWEETDDMFSGTCQPLPLK